MKKLVSVLLITAFAVAAFAQESTDGPSLQLSGEVKTGIYWQQVQNQGMPVVADGDTLKLHSTDDAGKNQGRFRLNLDFDSGKNFGMRGRIDWENWSNTDSQQPLWTYAFGYGNFFNEQMTVSVGKLGASPWGIGGPDIWTELEQYNNGGGARIEWKPAFIPVGRLNAGFVLNWFDSDTSEAQTTRTASFADILRESVLGISYTHDLFMARFAYRLDSDFDSMNGNAQGDEFIFRLEEYVLNDVLPGLQAYAIGRYRGVASKDPAYYHFVNWIYGEYDPPELFGLMTPFSAGIRLGVDYVGYDYDDDFPEYDFVDSYVNDHLDFIEPGPRGEFHVSPSFYWHFFNKLLSVGVMFSYRQDFGENKIWAGSPYQQIELEPKIQLNFVSSYIAFVYNWKQEYILGDYAQRGGNDPTRRTQYINLRFCIYY